MCVRVHKRHDAGLREWGTPPPRRPGAVAQLDGVLGLLAVLGMVAAFVEVFAERLYEAACVQRSWPAAEWRRYLAQHPIVGALCRRVVWAAASPDAPEQPLRFAPAIGASCMT
jgi:hypothetical protein